MSLATRSALYGFGWQTFQTLDNLSAMFATGAGAQAQGLSLTGEMNRITKSVATGACVLKGILSAEAPPVVIVVNDSPNSINVGAAAGEKINNVATTSTFGAGVLAVAAGAVGIFLRVTNDQGGLDWRAAAIT